MKKYKIYISSSYRYTENKESALKMVKLYLNDGFDVSISETEVLEE